MQIDLLRNHNSASDILQRPRLARSCCQVRIATGDVTLRTCPLCSMLLFNLLLFLRASYPVQPLSATVAFLLSDSSFLLQLFASPYQIAHVSVSTVVA